MKIDPVHIVFGFIKKNTRINLSDEKQASLEQILRFCLVGLSNTVIGYAVYVFVVFIMQKCRLLPKYDYYIGNVISWILSVAWSFYWNNCYVFTAEKRNGHQFFKALLKCYASYAISGLLITNLLSFLWINICGINRYIAPIITLVITIPVNYMLNKYWAFRHSNRILEKTESEKNEEN